MNKLNDVYKHSVVSVLVVGTAFLFVALLSLPRDSKGLLAFIRGEKEGEQQEFVINQEVGLASTEVPLLRKANDEIARVVEQVSPSVVSITSEYSKGNKTRMVEQGSGVIITESGHVVTNYHVIASKTALPLRYQVELIDGTLFEADLVGVDPVIDIALLKMKGEQKFKPMALGDSDSVQVGHRVFTFGNPYRLGVTFSAGNIAAKDRFLSEIQHDLFQITAPLNPGQSGGPLVNIKGELVGINSAIYSKDKQFPGFQGIAFAIRGNEVKDSITAIFKKERPLRGYLGVMLGKLNNYNRKALKYAKKSGALIYSVAAGSPAEEAGLMRQDIITSFDGKPIAEGYHLISLLKRNANKRVVLTVWRDGKEQKVDVKLIEAGKVVQEPEKTSKDKKLAALYNKIGIIPVDLSIEERSNGLSGVRVSKVEPGSLAETSDIRVGDYIILMNGMRLTSVPVFLAMLRTSVLERQTELLIERPHQGAKTVRFPKLTLE